MMPNLFLCFFSSGSPYFPYGLLPTPPTPSPLIPPPFHPSAPSVDSLSSVTSPTAGGHSVMPPLPGMPTRRPSNPFKPPPLKKYKCEECGKAFSRSNTLVTHKVRIYHLYKFRLFCLKYIFLTNLRPFAIWWSVY